jgi:hypothetical protein
MYYRLFVSADTFAIAFGLAGLDSVGAVTDSRL